MDRLSNIAIAAVKFGYDQQKSLNSTVLDRLKIHLLTSRYFSSPDRDNNIAWIWDTTELSPLPEDMQIDLLNFDFLFLREKVFKPAFGEAFDDDCGFDFNYYLDPANGPRALCRYCLRDSWLETSYEENVVFDKNTGKPRCVRCGAKRNFQKKVGKRYVGIDLDVTESPREAAAEKARERDEKMRADWCKDWIDNDETY